MLEVKLKEIVEKNVIKGVDELQFWKDVDNNDRMITIGVESNYLHAYHFFANDTTGEGVFNTCGADDFERNWLEDSSYVECDSNWQPIKPIGTIELINLKGIHYWKTKYGDLYMSMWNRLHGIEPTLIPVDSKTSRPLVFTNEQELLLEMKRLNLYKVSNMRLEEF